MKRIISLLMCVVMVCSMFTLSVNAAEDYFPQFDSAVNSLWWSVYYGGQAENIYEFSPKHIKWYTTREINIYEFGSYEKEYTYTYDGDDFTYTVRYFAIPADFYEAEAVKYFNISDINTLRSDTNHDPVYNEETHTYDMPDAGGFGDSVTYLTKGYKDIGDGKFEVYGYTVEQAYEKPDDAVEGVDYIINYDYPVEILQCLRVTVEYNGTDVKFISWEIIEVDEMPDDSDLIIHTHTLSSWIIGFEATVNSSGYKYKECTSCGDIFEFTEIPQLKCSKPKLKSIENTEHGVLVKWGKVKGADSYDIYRKTGSSGKYSKIGTTTKTYYTDKTAKSGKKYYYYVKAENEAGLSSASSSLSKYHLADTSLKTPSSTKNGITLKWSKVTGAEGYYVYRKTGSGSYEKIATVKGNSKVTYTDKKAKKGKTYTYKIKAYKSKTTSAYSNAKKIKDKY